MKSGGVLLQFGGKSRRSNVTRAISRWERQKQTHKFARRLSFAGAPPFLAKFIAAEYLHS
jgi:hypothetical protein